MNIKKKDYHALSKSQIWIINALLRLMEDQDYSKITVKEITLEADLARATFYLNYKSKDDVLKSYIAELYQEFLNEAIQLPKPDLYQMALLYFEFWAGYMDFVILLQKHNLFFMLLEAYEQCLPQLSESFYPFNIFESKNIRQEDLQYFTCFHAAGLWNILKAWTNSGAKDSPQKLAELYVKFSM